MTMITASQKAQARDLLDQMIANDFSRQSMELRLDEVEAQAKRLDDRDEMRNLLAIAGEIRRLMQVDRKLARAGIVGARHLKPYSQL